MDKRGALKVTTEYLLSAYSFKNMPLQYLSQVEQYSKTIRKVKIKLNTFKKKNAVCAKSFSVFKVSARSSAGQSNGLLNRRS